MRTETKEQLESLARMISQLEADIDIEGVAVRIASRKLKDMELELHLLLQEVGRLEGER